MMRVKLKKLGATLITKEPTLSTIIFDEFEEKGGDVTILWVNKTIQDWNATFSSANQNQGKLLSTIDDLLLPVM